MKRILALLLAVLLLTGSALAAGSFHAGVTFGVDDAGHTTITVQDSEIFRTEKTTLTVACDYDEAYVVLGGQVVESNLADGMITFTVISGGTYTILQGKAPAEPADPAEPAAPAEKPAAEQKPGKAPEFTDVKSDDWFYEDVAYVWANGLMNGTGEKTFDPYGGTSRAMVVTVLWRLAGEPEPQGKCVFTDVEPGAYYEIAVAWAMEQRIVTGVSSDAFAPNDAITREQLAAILYRYARELEGRDVTAAGDLTRYSDADQVSPYAKTALQWACGIGLIQGADGRLLPGSGATRAQVAAILHRFVT